jgi:hypothetical protein
MPQWQKAKVTRAKSGTNSEEELRSQLARQESELNNLRKLLEEEKQYLRHQEELAKRTKIPAAKAKFIAIGAAWAPKARIRFENYSNVPASISLGPKIFDIYGWQVGKDWLTSILTCADYKSGTDEFVHYKIPQEHANIVDKSLCKLILYCIITMEVGDGRRGRENTQTIEERNFQGGLIVIEMHFTQKPPVGRKAAGKAMETIKRTMDKTLKQSEVRCDLSLPLHGYGMSSCRNDTC